MILFQDVDFAYESGAFVFRKLDLEIGPGLTLILGPNGSGKSTALKLAAGVETPDAGRVFIDGFDLAKAEVPARRALAYLPEQPDLTPYATIRDILRLVARLRREPVSAAEEALAFFGLEAESSKSVRELSLGQKRRATFAAAFIGRPSHLLLDEPLEALDREIRDRVLVRFAERLKDGASVLVVSHDIDPFSPLAARALALLPGKARLVDPLPEGTEERRRLLDLLARGDWTPIVTGDREPMA
jgi:ABC-type multidrug transport system ATPase subunit